MRLANCFLDSLWMTEISDWLGETLCDPQTTKLVEGTPELVSQAQC